MADPPESLEEELRDWLDTSSSKGVGWKGPDGQRTESVGHASGRRLVTILRKAPGERTADDDTVYVRASGFDAVKAKKDAVLSVVRVDTYDEALKMVNDNPYGNGVAIFTRDGGAARRFQSEVEVGMVGVNVPIPVPIGAFSFGGWKDSLFGDAHIYGPESIHFYTRSKVVTTRWPDHTQSQVDLGFPANH